MNDKKKKREKNCVNLKLVQFILEIEKQQFIISEILNTVCEFDL